MKPVPFYRPSPRFVSSGRPTNRIRRGGAFTLILSHLVLLVALGLSLRWNVVRAREHRAALDRAYARGCIAGVAWAEAIINRALADETTWEREPKAEPASEDKL